MFYYALYHLSFWFLSENHKVIKVLPVKSYFHNYNKENRLEASHTICIHSENNMLQFSQHFKFKLNILRANKWKHEFYLMTTSLHNCLENVTRADCVSFSQTDAISMGIDILWFPERCTLFCLFRVITVRCHDSEYIMSGLSLCL